MTFEEGYATEDGELWSETKTHRDLTPGSRLRKAPG